MNMDKTYKLIDTVSKGTHARKDINPNLIVGSDNNGYMRGDILDANAVKTLIDNGDQIDQNDIDSISERTSALEGNVESLQNNTQQMSTDISNMQQDLSDIYDEIGEPTSQDANTIWHDIESLKGLISADDPVGAIDKFDEITNFLDNVEGTTLNGILSNFVRQDSIQDVVRTADIANNVESSSIRNIVVLTQAQYDALATKDANTEYNIIESV